MSDANDTDHRDHWRELAMQLGLPPEAEAAEEARETPADKCGGTDDPRPGRIASSGGEIEHRPSHGRSTRARLPEPLADERPPVDAELTFGPPTATPEDTLAPGGPDTPPEETSRPEEERERGRSRRRGGRRRGRSAEEPVPSPGEAEGSGEEATGSEGGGGRRGRRGRGRRPEPVAGDETDGFADDLEDRAEEPEEPSVGPEPEADEEVDTLSDWNVPSWADIIASLYRPDR